MKTLLGTITLLLAAVQALAQPAPIPRPPDLPELEYRVVPDIFKLPANANFGSTSAVAVNSKGNIIVLNRGPQPLMEFDASGRFIRAFGEGLFERPHGLHIDSEDNIWATDGGSHVVYKFNPQGRIQMVLGVRGSPGEWHPVTPLRLFTEPNDVAIAPNGDIYVTQGHGGKGENRVVRFDKNGTHLKSWGKRGSGPGEFDAPHGVAVDANGLVYIADRGNKRIQIFDADGNFVKEWPLFGTPCGLVIKDGSVWLANGHAGQIVQLDMNGRVLGITGGQGKGTGQYGEAHFMAVTAKGELLIADTLNWRVTKLVKK
jgi:DNA-binding beta-propeller fold protein YncE